MIQVPLLSAILLMGCDDTGATVECDIPRVGPRQLVDDGVCRPTEDS